jgi:DNA invertase Pin-like site-specific DNA recombinase
MDRLARNLDDLRRIVHTLSGKGVKVEFVKEHLTFTGDDSPMGGLLVRIGAENGTTEAHKRRTNRALLGDVRRGLALHWVRPISGG